MAEAQARRQGLSVRTWATIGLMALLSACQVVPKGPPRTPPPPPPVETPEPVNPSLPTDTERHRVALLVPLSGPNAGVGTSISNAANLAVLDTGASRIRITTYDTGPGAAAAARRAIAEGNRIILGPLLADDVRSVAPLARAAKVPVVSFSNDTSVAGQGVYLMGYLPAQSIGRVVDYARGKGVTKFAGLIPAGLYGQRSSTAFLRAVEAGGGQVVSLQTFDRSGGSLNAAITRLAQGSPYEAVLIADSSRAAAMAAPLLRAKGGATARLLGTELWNADTTLGSIAALRGAWFASVSDGLYTQLARKYRQRYGRAPYRIASLGYDGVLLVTRIGAEWRVGTSFPQARLSEPGGFSGIDGAFRFNRDGIAERALEVQQVAGTGLTIVSPAPRGF
jgi:branched-chain amino acid transport system substrate-binding protein